MKTKENLSVLALCSHCSAVKTELVENANQTHKIENGAFWERFVFNVNAKKETSENTSHSFVGRLFVTRHSKSRLAPS